MRLDRNRNRSTRSCSWVGAESHIPCRSFLGPTIVLRRTLSYVIPCMSATPHLPHLPLFVLALSALCSALFALWPPLSPVVRRGALHFRSGRAIGRQSSKRRRISLISGDMFCRQQSDELCYLPRMLRTTGNAIAQAIIMIIHHVHVGSQFARSTPMPTPPRTLAVTYKSA